MNNSRNVLSAKNAMELSGVLGHTIGQAEISDERAAELVKTAKTWQPTVVEILRGVSKPIGNWLDAILARQKEVFGDLASKADLDFFVATLEDTRFGQEKVAAWQRLKLEPFCLSRKVFDAEFLASRPPFSPFYRDQVAAKNIKRMVDGQLVPVENIGLDGIVALVDTCIKPAYKNGKQMFPEDGKFLGPIIKRLRQSGDIAKYDAGPATSRFGVSADEWRDKIQPALSSRPEFAGVKWELESYPLFWLLGQTLRPGDDDTNTGVWFEEYFKDVAFRLHGGDCDIGGLAHCYCGYSSSHWRSRGFRPLGVLDTLPLVS